MAGPLISNGHCGVCSAKSKVAGSTPLCVVGLLKGAGRDRGRGTPRCVAPSTPSRSTSISTRPPASTPTRTSRTTNPWVSFTELVFYKSLTYHQRITFITKMSPFYLFIPTFTMRLETLVSPTYHSHITSIPNPQQASPRRNPRRRRALRRGRREPPGA